MGKDDVCVHCGRDVPPDQRVEGAPHTLCQGCYERTDSLRRYWSKDWGVDPRDKGRLV